MKSELNSAQKRWKGAAILWPVLCLVFAGIIVFQSVTGMEGRSLEDAAFAIVPLVFFGIGMAMGYHVLEERKCATAWTTATVASRGKRVRSGKKSYFPEYEFQVGKETYKVTSPKGYHVCLVTEGRKVKLYYAPENPRIFYAPVMQRHERRWSALWCGIGIACPLIGLFAPLMRT